MMDRNHVAKRIAIALAVIGLVLASAGVASFALASGSLQADASQTVGAVADDGGALLEFPIDNATFSVDSSVLTLEFPIDNVTVVQISSGIASSAFVPGQDMDPYVVDQDMDPY